MVVTEQEEALTVVLLGALPQSAMPGNVQRGSSLPRIQTAALTAGQVSITRGEAGPRVARLHAELFELGFLAKLGTPPYFGVSTYAAVRKFQQTWGLSPDGEVGHETQRRLSEALERLRSGRGSRALSYTVRQGDSLLRISQTLLGDAGRWREILEFNNLSDPNRIVPGTILHIPPRN